MSSKMVGNLRFVINGRYVCNQKIEVTTKTGDKITIQPNTILIVNRFEDSVPILRWMVFDLKKFVEIYAIDTVAENLTNIC